MVKERRLAGGRLSMAPVLGRLVRVPVPLSLPATAVGLAHVAPQPAVLHARRRLVRVAARRRVWTSLGELSVRTADFEIEGGGCVCAMDELTGLGAAELARRIRAEDTSPLEVVDAHIARINEVEPHVNSLVTATFGRARSTAQRLTDAGVPADPPPLHGVPVTVKDAIPVVGIRFTAGSDALREHVADRDAEAVRRMKAAGAIVLGKSSCSEMSGSMRDEQPHCRSDAESVEPRPVRWRQFGWRGGHHCRWWFATRAGIRHRRQHPCSGRILWRRRPEADFGAHLDRRACAKGGDGRGRLEHGRPDGAPGRGPSPRARRPVEVAAARRSGDLSEGPACTRTSVRRWASGPSRGRRRRDGCRRHTQRCRNVGTTARYASPVEDTVRGDRNPASPLAAELP